MGFLQRVSTVVAPRMSRASIGQDYNRAFFAGDSLPELWLGGLSAAGVSVSPELAMSLSAFASGVRMISSDLATLPPKVYRVLDDGGKEPVRFTGIGQGAGGIGDLAYKLRWAPNVWQTSAEFFAGMFAPFVMRGVAYAEIVNSPQGWLDQLLPRHPDRVRTERLPSGRLRYRLTEGAAGSRYLTQDEMFTVRDFSLDGFNPVSRVAFGANAIGAILAAEQAAGKFFKSGMMAATVATYEGQLDEEQEADLHKSITRFAGGVENSFGLMLVPDNIKIANLAIEPEKAQMMLAREWGVREIARLLGMPGSKLGVPGTQTYASAVQLAVDYVIGCLRPIAVMFEQAMQRDLILAKGVYVIEFLLDALMRGDPDSRAAYYERAIRNRWMRPSEVRLRENLNPDAELDRLSEGDFRPGTGTTTGKPPTDAGPGARVLLHTFLALHDQAVRCCRRERAAIERLAKKHAHDPSGWQVALRDFYGEHAGFIAQTMRMPLAIARGYAAEHGSQMEACGVALIDGEAGGAWEREEADALASLALDIGRAA